VKIHTAPGVIVTKHALSALEAMLPSSFLRVHRSFIVSLSKINTFTQEEIGIQQNLIPIGKLYRQQVLKVLTLKNGS
jgi:DNA-binding LytR/AlgR family response regulator